MRRVVTDTNIFISAFVFGGTPLRFVEFARQKRFLMVTSPVLLDELDETLRGKFRWSIAAVDKLRSGLEQLCEIVSTVPIIQAVAADPDDDRVLECAIVAAADCIVSGDRHLLDLGSYEGVPVQTVRQFLDQLLPAT
jgi:putative PIN family toxin of toxin-antitoxin system